MLSICIVVVAIASITSMVAGAPSGKPTGGPGIATLNVYSSYQCPNNTDFPPTDGSAGTLRTVTITEDTCSQIALPLGSALTAVLTQAPKTGSAGCYVQIFSASGCGLTLDNQYHGFALNGVSAGSHLFCANVPVMSYGAAELVCV